MDVRETYRRVMMALARGVVRRVAPAAGMQVLQLGLMADETKDGVEHFEPYGWTSHPEPGAEAAVLFVGGNRDHGLAVVVADRRHRPRDLQPGEACVYSRHGQRILLKEGGDVVLVPGPGGRILLGGDGADRQVARVGDRVQVGSGSSAGLWPIVEGADAVRST